MHTLERSQFIAAPVDDLFAFFSNAANLEAITPPWLGFKMLTPGPVAIEGGTILEYGLRVHGVPLRWRSLISRWNPPSGFVDEQLSGPYRTWVHEHVFEPVEGGTLMCDTVRYELPLGALGRLVERFWVRRDLARIFDYRAEKIAAMWRAR
jgi:hypothetical protein